MLQDVGGGWLLADFELADRNGESLPHYYWDGECVPPEARGGGVYSTQGDVWQVGKLVQDWGRDEPGELGSEAQRFSWWLMSEEAEERPTAEGALASEWGRKG